jgi:hypothetical protein
VIAPSGAIVQGGTITATTSSAATDPRTGQTGPTSFTFEINQGFIRGEILGGATYDFVINAGGEQWSYNGAVGSHTSEAFTIEELRQGQTEMDEESGEDATFGNVTVTGDLVVTGSLSMGTASGSYTVFDVDVYGTLAVIGEDAGINMDSGADLNLSEGARITVDEYTTTTAIACRVLDYSSGDMYVEFDNGAGGELKLNIVSGEDIDIEATSTLTADGATINIGPVAAAAMAIGNTAVTSFTLDAANIDVSAVTLLSLNAVSAQFANDTAATAVTVGNAAAAFTLAAATLDVDATTSIAIDSPTIGIGEDTSSQTLNIGNAVAAATLNALTLAVNAAGTLDLGATTSIDISAPAITINTDTSMTPVSYVIGQSGIGAFSAYANTFALGDASATAFAIVGDVVSIDAATSFALDAAAINIGTDTAFADDITVGNGTGDIVLDGSAVQLTAPGALKVASLELTSTDIINFNSATALSLASTQVVSYFPVNGQVGSDTDADTTQVLLTGVGAGYGLLIIGVRPDNQTGIFRVADTAIVSISAGTDFTTDAADTNGYNVYWDTTQTPDQFVVENMVGNNKSIAAAFFGVKVDVAA